MELITVSYLYVVASLSVSVSLLPQQIIHSVHVFWPFFEKESLQKLFFEGILSQMSANKEPTEGKSRVFVFIQEEKHIRSWTSSNTACYKFN